MKKINKAGILAAGRGTRLKPITTTTPKCMLPLLGKPILEHIIIELKKAGIRELSIVVGYKKDSIIEHFEGKRSREIEDMEISYVEQGEANGTAKAIGLLNFNEDFLVVNGDTVFESSDIKNIISHYERAKKRNSNLAGAIGYYAVDNPEDYGIVTTKKGKKKPEIVERIVEKPKQRISDKASTGIYVFSPEIFEAIEKTEKSERGEYEITSSIQLLIAKGREFIACEVKKAWNDIGNPWNYLDANKIFLEKMQNRILGNIEEFVKIKGKIFLGKNSVIKSGTYIEGPAYIGENCSIGPNAFIRSYAHIGNNCRIGNAVEIKNSIIMDNTKISHLSYVGDSIIGKNCNLGAGTLVGNLRLDEKSIKMKIGDEIIDSKRKKFGCVVGDNVKTGINVMINAGKKIGSGAMIGPGVIIYDDIPENEFIVKKQEIIKKSKIR